MHRSMVFKRDYGTCIGFNSDISMRPLLQNKGNAPTMT